MADQLETSGLFEGLQWGTTNPPSTGMGIVNGGDLSGGSELRVHQGIGGTERRSDDLLKYGGNCNFLLSFTNFPFVQKAQRASYPRGSLTSLYIEGGAENWSRVYSDALIRTLKLSSDEGGAISGSAEWNALAIAEGDGLTPVDETADVFEDYETVVTIGGLEYGVLAWSINLDNKVSDPKTNQDAKTSGTYRNPQFRLVGLEELTLEVTTGRPIDPDVLALFGDVTTENLATVITAGNGAQTFTATFANLKPNKPEGFGLVAPDEQGKWTYGFRGRGDTGSLTLAMA